MTRIAHITDLHFGAEDPDVVRGLVAELNTEPPDLVVISGDLTQGAHAEEFAAARAFIASLRAPSLAVPGNHDIPPYDLVERLVDPYRRWRAAIGPDTEPTWQDGQVAVFGLNTARRLGLHWDWSHGRITRRRLHRLVARMQSVPAKRRVVVAHHPLLPPEDAPQTTIVGGADRALAAFAALDVCLVLAGHLHRGFARLATPGDGAPLILQGATATSVRLRGEPNAYNRITLTQGEPPFVEVRVWTGTAWATRAETVAA